MKSGKINPLLYNDKSTTTNKRDTRKFRYPICGVCDRVEFGHANTCAPLADGNVMLGFRVLNLICIVDRATKQITWEMCDP